MERKNQKKILSFKRTKFFPLTSEGTRFVNGPLRTEGLNNKFKRNRTVNKVIIVIIHGNKISIRLRRKIRKKGKRSRNVSHKPGCSR